MALNIGQIVAATLPAMLKSMNLPCPDMRQYLENWSYRRRLDEPRVNMAGQVIPRRAIVERNLAVYMRKPPRPPNLPE